jgi:cell division protein FtsA
VNANDELDLKKIDPNEEGKINLKYVSEIIEARLNEILVMIRDELRKIGREGMLPAGVILTGGGSKQDGIVELTKNVLRLPASVGTLTHDVSGMIDNISDPLYSASVGLMLWGLEAGNAPSTSKRSGGVPLGSALSKARNLFKNILP